MHGTTRAIVANMIKGVTDGYEKVLQIIGTGYKAELKNGNVVLSGTGQELLNDDKVKAAYLGA